MQPSPAFIGRQPVLNRNQQIIGYQLLFRPVATGSMPAADDEPANGAHVLVNTLSNMDAAALIGNKFAFIKVGQGLLVSEFLELLHPRRVILELCPSLPASAEMRRRVIHLRQHGFGLALDDYQPGGEQDSFLPAINYVKLNLARLGQERLEKTAATLRQHPVILIAEQVESHDDFRWCRSIGIDGFQGHYFTRAETLNNRSVHPQLANIINLLNMLRGNADLDEIELGFRQDVAMSYKLFHYINSAGFALVNEVASFRQAVTLLGYQKLYRWLTLLLVTASEEVGAPSALLKTAVTRGRFMELLTRNLGHGHESDNGFIVGMFSLIHVLLEMPLESALDNLLLPEIARHALLEQSGWLGQLLQLVIACEDPALRDVQVLAEALGLSAQTLNSAHVAALGWVEELRI